MTFEQACQIYYIYMEIKALQLDLARLKEERRYVKATNLTGMPNGKGGYKNWMDEYLIKEEELQNLLNENLYKLQVERKNFEEFLQGVEDAQMRLILRLRCVNNLSWEAIGEELDKDRRTVSNKFKKFFLLYSK